jgi:hypothetical protein
MEGEKLASWAAERRSGDDRRQTARGGRRIGDTLLHLVTLMQDEVRDELNVRLALTDPRAEAPAARGLSALRRPTPPTGGAAMPRGVPLPLPEATL